MTLLPEGKKTIKFRAVKGPLKKVLRSAVFLLQIHFFGELSGSIDKDFP
jgi:hypothetical protein